ncbi:MAG: hypothetical protein HPY74_18285 [Firmicutes bacterium]|nr:hypothetical protein [Bacillota bacterium]
MISIYKKLKRVDLRSQELHDWLDKKFQGRLVFQPEESELNIKYNYMLETNMDEWGFDYCKSAPKDVKEFIQYTALNCISFTYKNLVGRTLFRYVFPEFFQRFPLGQIWLIETDENWFLTSWATQKKFADKNGMKSFIGEYPQEFSGFQEENLLNMALEVLSYSLYPLLFCEIVPVSPDLTLMFIPDRAMQYSQMKEAETLYVHLLWKFHHIFDDQWTFDSSRGPKTAADSTVFNPINILDYFEWYIDLLNYRLEELNHMSEDHIRQQRAMTLNSTICDLFFCISSEIPYLSKMSFFNVVDKISNYMHALGRGKSETDIWRRLLSKEFLSDELINCIKNVPGIIGEELILNIKWVLEQIDMNKISADLLRDLRNSKHGYLLNQSRWEKLCKHTCEIHNDLVLLALPLWLYVLASKWT